MSRNLFTAIEVKDVNGWHMVNLFDADKHRATLWPWNATYDLFEILSNENYDVTTIHNGIPDDVSAEVKDYFKSDIEDGYQFHWMTGLAIDYEIMRRPKVVDDDAMEEKCTSSKWNTVPFDQIPKEYKDSPLVEFNTAIKYYIEYAGEFYCNREDVRIIYYIG